VIHRKSGRHSRVPSRDELERRSEGWAKGTLVFQAKGEASLGDSLYSAGA
jgi:hypothetical protein